MRIVLVHHGYVVELVPLLLQHTPHAIIENDREFVGESRVISSAVRYRRCHHVTRSILMLQSLAAESSATGCGTEQEPACALISRCPDKISHALKTEH